MQANEQSQLQPPGRKRLLTPMRNDGMMGANAASMTEWSSIQRPPDEARGWWLLAGLKG